MWMLNIKIIRNGKDRESLIFKFKSLYDVYKMIEKMEESIVLNVDETALYLVQQIKEV